MLRAGARRTPRDAHRARLSRQRPAHDSRAEHSRLAAGARHVHARLVFATEVDQPSLTRRLEELDRVSVWVFQLDLTAGGSGFHLIPKPQIGLLQLLDPARQVAHA